MVMIGSRDYKIVYGELGVGSDLRELSVRHGLKIDTLTSILHQKIVRETMHKHHKIQAMAHKLKNRWQQGETIPELAKEINFPPVMTAWITLEAKGLSRSVFRAMLKNPDRIPDKRLKKEITTAIKQDLVYSPDAIADQMKRSKMVEEKIRKWLLKKGITFIDEKEAKEKNHKKTPDFLLKKTLPSEKQKIHWVECKASFGDETEVKRDYRKQLRHYVELYGSGIVVYWDGFLENIKLDNITLLSGEMFT
jgi:hypothetical protein